MVTCNEPDVPDDLYDKKSILFLWKKHDVGRQHNVNDLRCFYETGRTTAAGVKSVDWVFFCFCLVSFRFIPLEPHPFGGRNYLELEGIHFYSGRRAVRLGEA